MTSWPTIAELRQTLHTDGIVSVPAALSREWAAQLDEDLGQEFVRALSAPGGTAPRGWNRFYFEPYPERVRGFLEWVTHPLVTGLALDLFGPGYQVVELGCDTPLPGAVDQPWHRDFPTPEVTRTERRLTSFAVNASAVDVTADMGPFQVVPGTQFDDGTAFDGGMFPPAADGAAYEARMTSVYGRRGGMSIRTGLTLHRGSASAVTAAKRQVAILGVVSPEDRAVRDRDADPASYVAPRLRVSREFFDSLDPELAAHLSCEIVSERSDALPPHVTHHDFEACG